MAFVSSLSAPWEETFADCRERTTARSLRRPRTDVVMHSSQWALRPRCRTNPLGWRSKLTLLAGTKGFRQFHSGTSKLYRVEP